MKASVKWFDGARRKEEKEEIYSILLSAKPAFDRLAQIIENEKETSRKYRESKQGYDIPNWAYLQADGVGEDRAYNNILKLLSIKLED